MKLERKPYLILFIVLIAGGVTAAYAITITLGGDVSITGALAVIGAITSPTTDTMQSNIDNLDTRVTTLEGGCTPTTEVCDGLDNDCDNIIDNGFLNIGTGKYDQDVACGNCGTDCTTINTVNAVDTCDSTGTPICVFSCDTGFLDVNGLAVDGCEFAVDANGIYVSETDGSALDTVGCGSGSITAPCATITFGLGRAVAESKTTVYVADGFYNESITLVAGIDLLGGYEANTWTRHVSSTLTIIQGDSVSTHRETITASSITTSTTLDGFIIVGQDNPTAGGNSYGIRIVDSDSALVVSNNQIFTGSGGIGTIGSAGTSGANGVAGSAGLVGFSTGEAPCGSGNDVQLSNGGTLSCSGTVVNGGNGGGVQCPPNFQTETSGTDGFDGSGGGGMINGATGAGGDAGEDARLESGGSICNVTSVPTQLGTDGSNGSDAGNGFSGGACSSPAGSVIGNHWVGGSGVAGSAGGHGGGAGGGGAGGGSESGSGVTDDRLGSHGGGGGSGACGGDGGSGGTAGGGSFGIIVIGGVSAPTITNNEIRLGNGGLGGAGGFAGVGGLGGSGFAAPGAGPFCTGDAGAGGDGGDGGQGGGGGGSCGGVSYGIYTFGVPGDLTSLTTGNTFITIGSPGAGGAGGLSLGNNGGNGLTGSQESTSFN